MAKRILDDDLWELIEPLLPPQKPRRKRFPGRKPIEARKALTGILFVLKTGIGWEYLPQEMGCGSGMTCWRRLRDWNAAGVWDKIHRVLLERLHNADKLDWSRAVIDSSSVRAVLGGARPAQASKHHVVTDGNGIPLAAHTTGANRHDVTQVNSLIDGIPPVRGKTGRPRRRPEVVYGDRAYDSQPHRDSLSALGIRSRLARRGDAHGSGLGKIRWVVERTMSWLHQYRRLRVRYERRADIHDAFLKIGCALICYKKLRASLC
jgi:transposase